MNFNNFYISGNRNKCPLRIGCLLTCFICDVNMTSLSHQLKELHLLHVWCSLKQSLIDHAVDQWPTCFDLFSLYLVNFMFHTMLDAAGDVLRVHYESVKCDVSFLQDSISTTVR